MDETVCRQRIVWLDLLDPSAARSAEPDGRSCDVVSILPSRCPIVIYGHRYKVYFFADTRGHFRRLTMRQMHDICEFVSLFHRDLGWLERGFPRVGTVGRGRITKRGWSFAAARNHVLGIASAHLTVAQIQSYEITTRIAGRRDRADRARAAGAPARGRR